MEKKLKWIFAGCFYAFFVNGMLALIFGAVMPSILTDYNMGYDKGGMLLSCQSMGNLIASFSGGIISSYLGRKNSIVMLSSMSVIGFIGMIITKSPLILLVMFFMTGIGRGSVSNISNAIVNDVSNGKPGPLNILHTFFAIGAFMAPFIASWFFSKNLTWKYPIGILAILAITMVIVFSLMNIDNVRHKKEKKSKNEKTSFDFLKNSDFYLSSGILFFYVGVEYAVNGWIVTYLKDTGIMSTSLAQKILSILWIVIIVGRLFCAYISKLIDKKTILLISSTGTIIFFILFMMSSAIWQIVGCILGLGFCLSGIYPTTISNVGMVIKGSGLAMGSLLAISGLGGIIMPYVTGAVAESKGITGGMTTITVSVILMFLLTFINKFSGKSKSLVSSH